MGATQKIRPETITIELLPDESLYVERVLAGKTHSTLMLAKGTTEYRWYEEKLWALAQRLGSGGQQETRTNEKAQLLPVPD